MSSLKSHFYQTGDHVYIETSSTAPYQIRRIEDFQLGAEGNVEVRLACVYRRSNLPASLVSLADNLLAEEAGVAPPDGSGSGRLQRHLARQRELFPSRQTETVPVTRLRGRCSVGLLSGAERPEHYLLTENSFFYWLLYDPSQRSLVADRGEIRLGPEFQAPPPAAAAPLRPGEPDPERPRPPETLLWRPGRAADEQVDTVIRLARCVGTLARSLEPPPSGGRCGASLHLAAAAASRDSSQQHALNTLHAAGYSLDRAASALVGDGLALCRDQMDAWSPAEAQLFEQALAKCGKAFGDIRRDFLPWKSCSQLVEFYYLWKTSDRHLARRRTKAAAAAAAGHLARVSVPRLDWAETVPAPAKQAEGRGPACAGCSAWRSPGWFAWGWRRLCAPCWQHWRRYGGLPRPAADGEDPAVERRPARPAAAAQRRRRPAGRSGGGESFLVRPPPLLLLSRRLCLGRRRLRRLARCPLREVNGPATQAHCLQLLSELPDSELEKLAAGGGSGSGTSLARRRRLDSLFSEQSGRIALPAPTENTSPGALPVTGNLSTSPGRLSTTPGRALGTTPGRPVLRMRRPSISQTPRRRSSTS